MDDIIHKPNKCVHGILITGNGKAEYCQSCWIFDWDPILMSHIQWDKNGFFVGRPRPESKAVISDPSISHISNAVNPLWDGVAEIKLHRKRWHLPSEWFQSTKPLDLQEED